MEAILFSGIQATGKSTFFQDRFRNTHVRINLDMLRTRNREDLLLRACLEGVQPFVVDNTNPTIAERARYIAAAAQARFKIVGYYFESKAADALLRNQQRPADQQVPRVAILATCKKLQRPALEEGFDALSYVKLTENGGFLVEEWQR